MFFFSVHTAVVWAWQPTWTAGDDVNCTDEQDISTSLKVLFYFFTSQKPTECCLAGAELP